MDDGCFSRDEGTSTKVVSMMVDHRMYGKSLDCDGYRFLLALLIHEMDSSSTIKSNIFHGVVVQIKGVMRIRNLQRHNVAAPSIEQYSQNE